MNSAGEQKAISEEKENEILRKFVENNPLIINATTDLINTASEEGQYAVIIPVKEHYEKYLLRYLEKLNYIVDLQVTDLKIPKPKSNQVTEKRELIVRWV